MIRKTISATVTKTGPGGTPLPGHRWRVRLDDGTVIWAAIHARIRTTNTPTLQIGDEIRASWDDDTDTCSIALEDSPVAWTPRGRLPRPIRRAEDAGDRF
ncbi:hypothetical protein [Rubripirellula obstinata]|nr:hypothetical protein [Rubripirellula obstinata]